MHNLWHSKWQRTFLESSFIDCMFDWLESCVSEMMKGLDPASNTLWIFPESVGTAGWRQSQQRVQTMPDYEPGQQENTQGTNIRINLDFVEQCMFFKQEHTSGQKQDVIHLLVGCLDSIDSYFGVVVAADVKRSFIMRGVNPVSHFWVILHHIDSGQRQVSAVFHTLKHTRFCIFTGILRVVWGMHAL